MQCPMTISIGSAAARPAHCHELSTPWQWQGSPELVIEQHYELASLQQQQDSLAMARESCLSLILLVIFHLGNGKGHHHDFTLGMFPRAAMAVPVP